MSPFGKRKPKRKPKVIPPAAKRTPVIIPPNSDEIKLPGPKYYIPPERTTPRKNKALSEPTNVLALPSGGKIIQKKSESAIAKPLDAEKEFLRIFKKLTYMNSPWSTWQDFVVLFACSISNSVDKERFEKREALYMKTIEKYSKRDQELLSELIPVTVLALENNPEQDFLGRLYMILELQNDRKAQFFTPYGVCQVMSEITLADLVPEVKARGYVSINDPCCGAGATLIASIHTARRLLEREGINFQDHVLVVGQDIDMTVALMCYIQISLLGMAGYIKVGNSLTDPMVSGDSLENYWFTPIYFTEVWFVRRVLDRMDSLFQGKERSNG